MSKRKRKLNADDRKRMDMQADREDTRDRRELEAESIEDFLQWFGEMKKGVVRHNLTTPRNH